MGSGGQETKKGMDRKMKHLCNLLKIAIGFLAAVCLSGCGAKINFQRGGSRMEVSEEASEWNYENVIEAVRKCILDQEEEIPAEYGFSSAIKRSGNAEEPGYLVRDLNGDGTDELLIGCSGTEPGDSQHSVVYDIYTVWEGKLIHVLNGWERNRYYLCENGRIANEGSNGAADSSWTYFSFDGEKLILQEAVIYNEEKDQENPWFYCAGPECDLEKAIAISEEKGAEIRGKYTYSRLEFIPFIQEDSGV